MYTISSQQTIIKFYQSAGLRESLSFKGVIRQTDFNTKKYRSMKKYQHYKR